MVTLEELQSAEISDLPLRKRVEAFYKGTDALAQFAKEVMIPVLRGQISLNDKEKAIVGTYRRMYWWICSMVALNANIHFQGAASATRSLFELLLDIKILASDTKGDMVARFHAFPEIEKFRVADQLVSFCDQHKGKIAIKALHQRKFINKPGRRKNVDSAIITYWGKTKKGKPNWPDHWSGNNLRERARFLGFPYEELYVDVYPFLSWYVHAGSIGYAGFKEETIELCFGHCHGIAQRVFLEATIICAEQIKMVGAIDGFSDMLDKLSRVPGQCLFEEQIKFLTDRKMKESQVTIHLDKA